MITITKENPWLAPLAGYSDLAMRLLCRQYGAKVCVTEMVSSKGIFYQGKSTKDLLKTSPEEENLIVQIFASEASYLAESIHLIREEYGFEYFDINMGCSVPKVAKTGAGSAMLKDIDNLFKCAEAVIKASDKKTGFKFRLGYDMHKPVWQEIVPTLCQMGALYLVLHPRYAKQMFQGKADWSALRELKELSSVPVIASGDLFTAQDAIDCIKETNVDTVMFARGALTNPAIFRDYHKLLNNEEVIEASMEDAYAMVFDYATLCQKHFPERSLPRMRAFVPRILHNFHNVSHLRKAIASASSWEEFYSTMHEYYSMETGKIYESR